MKTTSFMNATLVNVTFHGFDFRNVNLMNTKFIHCKFDNCITDNGACFMNSEMINCDFIGVAPKRRPAPSIAEALGKPQEETKADDVLKFINDIMINYPECNEIILSALLHMRTDLNATPLEALWSSVREWNK